LNGRAFGCPNAAADLARACKSIFGAIEQMVVRYTPPT
jgi:hypothetical protein